MVDHGPAGAFDAFFCQRQRPVEGLPVHRRMVQMELEHGLDQGNQVGGRRQRERQLADGIGTAMHEEPQVPNYKTNRRGIKLMVGHVLAVEPMVNMGGPKTELRDDGWTVVTLDGSLSAHFEDTIAVTENGPEILTRLD